MAARRSKTAQHYAKLAHEDVVDADDSASVSTNASSAKALQRKAKMELADKVAQRIHCAFWVVRVQLAMVLTLYLTDFFNVILLSEEVDRFVFKFGLLCNGVFLSILLFLSVYLPFFKGRTDTRWEVDFPRMIPTATIAGFLSIVSYIWAFWNVWGFFTPAILLIIFIGGFMSLAIIPDCSCCHVKRKQ